jgi:hypothetical protein
MAYLFEWVYLFIKQQSPHMQRLVQLQKMSFLAKITIAEAYSPLDGSTKLASNDSNVQTWTKTLSTSFNL